MNDEWFVISDLDDFIDKMRTIVYTKFGNWDDESENSDLLNNINPNDIAEMDNILSYNESSNIITPQLKKQTHKTTKKIRYTLNDKIFANIIHDLNARMISNILNNLVKKGIVESSYDSESNDFVFWVKENK